MEMSHGEAFLGMAHSLWSSMAPSSAFQISHSEHELSVARANRNLMKPEQRQIKFPLSLFACPPPEIITAVKPLVPGSVWGRELWCNEPLDRSLNLKSEQSGQNKRQIMMICAYQTYFSLNIGCSYISSSAHLATWEKWEEGCH